MRAPRARGEAGAVAIIVSLVTSIVLFCVAALVVDLGLGRDTRRQAQIAADASALAAGNVLYAGTDPSPRFAAAVAAAKEYAAANYGVTEGDWAGCTDSGKLGYRPSSTSCISFDQQARPTLVRVLVPTRDVGGGFAGALGVNHIPVAAAARAEVTKAQASSCGLCFLGPVDAGNGDFTVQGGGILVNGDLGSGPNGIWTATNIGVVGTVSGGQFSPPWTTAAPITDPWADKPGVPPAVSGSVKSNACLEGPGRYGSFAVPNKGICLLLPGLYVITGEWSMKNKSNLAGLGVTLYFTCGTPGSPHVCASGEDGGSLDAKNGEVSLTAPAIGALSGLAIVYDRLVTRSLSLQGNGSTSISGAVYAPAAKLDFNGNSCFGFEHGPVIVDGVTKANGNKSCVIVRNSTDVTLASLPGTIGLDK